MSIGNLDVVSIRRTMWMLFCRIDTRGNDGQKLVEQRTAVLLKSILSTDSF